MTARGAGGGRRVVSQGRGRGSRLDRIAEQLRQELSAMILTELKDERVRLATVSAVTLSPDLRSAHVMVSALGTDEERRTTVAALHHAEGHLRGELGQRLENLKVVPRLHFELDESIAYSIRISSMLRQLVPDDASGAEHTEGDA
ncbi:MAG TPA: 30S ribosome-binding factor RbfA [Candidatus Dormibacteraeota bacterium]|nr:30S ribosome-binding factor RbfA [Candidatus Dormibacteraeota bacterium]